MFMSRPCVLQIESSTHLKIAQHIQSSWCSPLHTSPVQFECLHSRVESLLSCSLTSSLVASIHHRVLKFRLQVAKVTTKSRYKLSFVECPEWVVVQVMPLMISLMRVEWNQRSHSFGQYNHTMIAVMINWSSLVNEVKWNALMLNSKVTCLQWQSFGYDNHSFEDDWCLPLKVIPSKSRATSFVDC